MFRGIVAMIGRQLLDMKQGLNRNGRSQVFEYEIRDFHSIINHLINSRKTSMNVI